MNGRDAEAGTLSIFVAICATMMLMLTGLVMDGGGRLRAIERADALAQEAARAGGQQIDQAALLRGQGLKLDPAAAEAAANAYLDRNHITGTPVATTTMVTVTVDTTYRTSLLSIIGLDHLTVHGIGKARLVPGVSTAQPVPTGPS
ncbi:pilus assembly protein TadG-related protein [Streptacidiphilus cavernicola]|uniref:Pilus assembly protein TadG-related protein n=1 Tax=Streptacidiphilus cavernicola TaxID=3342716 RepID=A0ABV6W1A8_9ACTN